MTSIFSKSALLIPKVGTTIAVNPDEICHTLTKQRQIRLKYVEAEDVWVQVGKTQPGFILWLTETSSMETMTHVRVTRIMASGRTAWGELLSIKEST